jgi:hypothetical protein
MLRRWREWILDRRFPGSVPRMADLSDDEREQDARVRRVNSGALSGEHDEFGLPIEWRRVVEQHHDYPGLQGAWAIFERWCQERVVRAFPAALADVVAFFLDPPIRGQELENVLSAIDHRHDDLYWNSNADPGATMFEVGAHVLPDGSMFVPTELRPAEPPQ